MSFMMTFRWLVTLVVGLMCALPAAAQTVEPRPDDGAVREIYTVLALGDPVFSPERWMASAAETGTRTTATWTAASLGALAFAELLHFDGGYDERGLLEYFDGAWFDVTLKDYDAWERTGRCAFDGVTLNEFSLVLGGQDYRMRYWVQPITPTRVLAFHLVFPAARRQQLELYSQRYAPLAYTCAG